MRKLFAKLRTCAVHRWAPQVIAAVPTAGASSSDDDEKFVAVESLLEVDAYRQRLAAGDALLNQALGGIELTLAHQLGRQARQR
jgi:hypothetical protein